MKKTKKKTKEVGLLGIVGELEDMALYLYRRVGGMLEEAEHHLCEAVHSDNKEEERYYSGRMEVLIEIVKILHGE